MLKSNVLFLQSLNIRLAIVVSDMSKFSIPAIKKPPRSNQRCVVFGLKEAKDMCDAGNKVLKEGVSKKDAEEIKAKLTAAGAKVELK